VKKIKGFTLVELLITISILVIVFGMASTIIIQIIHANSKIAVQRQVILEARNAIEVIARQTRVAMGQRNQGQADAIVADPGGSSIQINQSPIGNGTGGDYVSYSLNPLTHEIEVTTGNIQNGTTREDLDIMLILDTTGSMTVCGDTNRKPCGKKIDYMKGAADDFIDYFTTQDSQGVSPPQDRIGAVAFSGCYTPTGATKLNSLTYSSSFSSIKNNIDALVPCDNTSMRSGIYQAVQELNSNIIVGRTAKKVAIVLSDGIANLNGTGSSSCSGVPTDLAVCEANIGWGAGNNNIEFYSLGLGTTTSTGIDQITLARIAHDYNAVTGQITPDDRYYYVNATDLKSVFLKIAGKITNDVLSCPGSATPGPCPPYELTSSQVDVTGAQFQQSFTSLQPFVTITLTIQSKNFGSSPDWKKASVTVQEVISSRDYSGS